MVLFTLVVVFFSISVGVQFWYYLTSKPCAPDKKLVGRTVIITGASAGIGKETAFDLASRGARLILGCRNIAKAQTVADEIIKETGNREVLVHKLDTSDLDSVRAFAKKVLDSEKHLHILINNAGAPGWVSRNYTKDDLEVTAATNHHGHFLLTNLLLNLLKSSAPSRIINVSSLAHTFVKKFDPTDLNFRKKPYDSFSAYAQSKLCNVLFTVALSDKLSGSDVTANSLHPGFVATEIFDKAGSWLSVAIKYFAPFFAKSCKTGAQTTIHLAVSDDVRNLTGKYFSDCSVTKTSKLADDLALANKVWETSEEEVKLQPDEIHY